VLVDVPGEWGWSQVRFGGARGYEDDVAFLVGGAANAVEDPGESRGAFGRLGSLERLMDADDGLLFQAKFRLSRRTVFGLFTFPFGCFGRLEIRNSSGFCLSFLLDVCFHFDSPLLLRLYLVPDILQCRLDNGNDDLGADIRQLVESFWRTILRPVNLIVCRGVSLHIATSPTVDLTGKLSAVSAVAGEGAPVVH
jgi:hypothetical protein